MENTKKFKNLNNTFDIEVESQSVGTPVVEVEEETNNNTDIRKAPELRGLRKNSGALDEPWRFTVCIDKPTLKH